MKKRNAFLLLLAGTSLAIAASFLAAQTSSGNPDDAPGVSSFSNGDAVPAMAEPRECDLRKGIDSACVFH